MYLLVHIPGTKDEYEDLLLVSGVIFEYEYTQKKKEEVKKVEEE